MATLRIGRADMALTTSVDTAISDLTISSSAVTFRGTLEGEREQLTRTIEQIVGYVDSLDEPVVPLLWDCLSTGWDGYYRVLDVEVIRDLPDLADLLITVQRVRGFAAPLFESTVLTAKRAEAAASVSHAPWMALPATVSGFELGPDLTPGSSLRASADGDMRYFTSSVLADARPTWHLPPADWYRGAPTITVGGHVVVGRQVPNTPTSWELSNGIVRLFGIPGSAEIGSQQWLGGGWSSVGEGRWHLLRYAGGTSTPYSDPPLTVTVLRNSPEESAIRLSYDAASMTPGSRFLVTLDISLRRGALAAVVRMTTRGLYRWGLRTSIPWSGATYNSDSSYAASGLVLHGLSRFDQELLQRYEDRTTIYTALTPFRTATWGWGYTGGSVTAAARLWAAAGVERTSVVQR